MADLVSPPTSIPEKEDDDQDTEVSPSESNQVKSKKTWGSTITNENDEKAPKTSFLSIMAEEEEISKAKQEQQREDDEINQAIQQSLQISREEEEIQLAIRLSMAAMESEGEEENSIPLASSAAATATIPTQAQGEEECGLSAEEMASIQEAIRQAEEEEARKSLQLAMELDLENEYMRKQAAQRPKSQGNVRTITREEYLMEQQGLLLKKDHDDHHIGNGGDYHGASAGFRINSQQNSSSWTRVDGMLVGPNNEVRTKHDPELHSQANAHRLQLDYDDEDGKPIARVGNKAFNSFKQTMKKKTVKGVASHGQGRANTDTEKTKEGALDSRVRLLIGKAINNDLMDKLNGCVKEGKEALVYHADKGRESGGYDVAVKVFKRIQEFRNRGQYVDGDPRYNAKEFSHSSGRDQLEIWTEKEYRNLTRAYRANVPVPKPLWYKENVLCMRFLGQDGWPSPQLKELKLKKSSRKWTALYEQTMGAIQRLFNDARLVHGDLSEYNLMICPQFLLLHDDDEEEEDSKSNTITATATTDREELTVALIDFGQAVDVRHPDAEDLLRRDLLRVKEFFDKVGITTIPVEAAMHFVRTHDAPLR